MPSLCGSVHLAWLTVPSITFYITQNRSSGLLMLEMILNIIVVDCLTAGQSSERLHGSHAVAQP